MTRSENMPLQYQKLLDEYVDGPLAETALGCALIVGISFAEGRIRRFPRWARAELSAYADACGGTGGDPPLGEAIDALLAEVDARIAARAAPAAVDAPVPDGRVAEIRRRAMTAADLIVELGRVSSTAHVIAREALMLVSDSLTCPTQASCAVGMRDSIAAAAQRMTIRTEGCVTISGVVGQYGDGADADVVLDALGGNSGETASVESARAVATLTEEQRRDIESMIVRFSAGPTDLRDALSAALDVVDRVGLAAHHRSTLEGHTGGWFAKADLIRDLLVVVDACSRDSAADSSRPSPDLFAERVISTGREAVARFRRRAMSLSWEVGVLEAAVRQALDSSVEGLVPILGLRVALEEVETSRSDGGVDVVVPGWETAEDLYRLESIARGVLAPSDSLAESGRRRLEFERVMTPEFVLRILGMARFATTTATADVAKIAGCARAHGDAARVYERSGSVRGAAELRRVENLLWALARGEHWSLVLDVAPSTTQPDHAVDVTLSADATSRLRAYVESRLPANAARLPDLQLRACAISCGLRHVSDGIVIDRDAMIVLESLAGRDFLDGAVEELLAAIEARMSRPGSRMG